MSLGILRNLTRARILRPKNVRFLMSSEKLVDVQVNEKTGVSTVTMNRPPVNGLNLDLLSDLLSVFSDLESERSRGVILTSSSPTVFSAGLDILEMYKPDQDRIEKFWLTLQDMWITLYGSSYPTVAAINGHSPAGGCLLACSCEYRVMVQGNYSIGLNETKLGIVAPFWFVDIFKNTVPLRTAELALTTGKLFTVDEALKVGLIDEVATDKNDAIAKAEKFLTQFAKIHPMARANTKNLLREAAIKRLEENKEEDLQSFLNYVKLPAVQKGLEIYMQSLKKK